MMVLKSFEIQGFKTFPDKIELPVETGVTAVVGPNGSGKSNIADALRWVLGEQNHRALRCEKKMEEIIFHGTQTRNQVGFAEVTLRLDNTQRLFAYDQDELAITRRLYRSGESEYYINKSAVRLKDITELLLDTGLGHEGYSIIGQGMVKKIISDRSGDRRKVFEEASGISKYRYRKEESERKLQHAQDNLVRIGDKIEELAPQVISLKSQAEKARRYLLLRDELRGAEINIWMDSLDKVRAGFDKLRDDYRTAREQSENGKVLLAALYAQSENIEALMIEKNVEAENARLELSREESLRNEAQAGTAVLKNELEHNQENIERIRGEIEQSENKAGGMAGQIENGMAALLELNELLAGIQSDMDALQAQASALAEQTGDVQARIEALRAEEIQGNTVCASIRAEITSNEAQLKELLARKQAIISDRDTRSEALAEAEKDLNAARADLERGQEQIAELGNVIDGYQLRKTKRQGRVDELREKTERMKLQMNTLTTRHNILLEQEKEYQGFSGAVRLIMQDKPRNVHGTVAELIHVEDTYTVAIEIALGSALQNIVVETEADAKAAIGLLKSRNAGRATFLPLSSVSGQEIENRYGDQPGMVAVASRLVHTDSRYREVINSLLGRTLIVETIDHAIELARKVSYRFRVVTLDGQVINTGGSITGGSVRQSTGLLSRKNEMERLSETIEELKTGLDNSNKDLSSAEREFSAVAYDLEVAQSEQREARENVASLTSDVEHKTVFVKQHVEHLAALEEESNTLNGRVEVIQKKISGLEEQEKERLTAVEALREKWTDLQESQSEAAGKNASISSEMERLRENKTEIQSKIAAEERAVTEMERLKNELAGDMEHRRDTLESYRKKGEELSGQLEQRLEDMSGLDRRLAEKKERLQEAYAGQQQIEGRRASNAHEIKQRNETNTELERECARMENKLVTGEAEEKSIVDRLWEHYELTPTTANELRTPMESLAKTNRQIAELRRDIAALGTPNIGAIDAYKEVSERYDMLTAQRDDAVTAKTELENIIAQITDEMKRIFTEQFASINEKFAKIFSEIFGGGQAYLELDDPDDILNCGVEIKAQPPGKKLRSISLLSGGETSLTAIALYFSLFKVRPAPFCVLDEIDHDLDDANVERFASYLYNFSKDTQFVVITHRRGTMERADILYGVTTQEAGVSKVISLRLAELEKELKLKI